MIRIFGIDPDLMVVVATGRAADDVDGFAAVIGAVESDVGGCRACPGFSGSMVMELKYQARLVMRGSELARVQESPLSSER
jgi:hypothetical protein